MNRSRLIRLVPVDPTDAQLNWDLRVFGGQVDVLSSLLGSTRNSGTILWCGRAAVNRGCTSSARILVWVERVKWHPHEYQHPR